jgi:hypothetical protein
MTQAQVACATCNRQFDRCIPETPDQAYGCSVEVRKEGKSLLATGHYGSLRFDGNHLDLTASKSQPNIGIACDDCIQTALDQGGRITGNYL